MENRFLYVESNQVPLTEIPWGDIKEGIIDPTTGKTYKGIVLEGCCVDLSNETSNNNNRFYDVPKYLEFLQILRKQIFSPKGVLGELEHPESYQVNPKNASHRLLDVWYDEQTKKAMVRLILLNTPNGLIAQEIIRSGGQLGISARAAGAERDNPDGTKYAVLKLLVTFDLVYHPGFSAAVLEFKCLNESQKFIQEASERKTGFAGVIFEGDLKKIKNKFSEYITLNECSSCFYEWFLNDLSESSKEENAANKNDEKVLAANEAGDKDKIESKLKTAAKEDLKEGENPEETQKFEEERVHFIGQMQQQQQLVKRKNQGKSYYQGAAGFLADNYSIGLNG